MLDVDTLVASPSRAPTYGIWFILPESIAYTARKYARSNYRAQLSNTISRRNLQLAAEVSSYFFYKKRAMRLGSSCVALSWAGSRITVAVCNTLALALRSIALALRSIALGLRSICDNTNRHYTYRHTRTVTTQTATVRTDTTRTVTTRTVALQHEPLHYNTNRHN